MFSPATMAAVQPPSLGAEPSSSNGAPLSPTLPEHCPGTESERAGLDDACEGCPNQQICATAPKGPDPDIPAITAALESVKHKILVLSGKGGVGKSTFAALLGWAFSYNEDNEVALLDLDFCGPSLARIMGTEGEQIHSSAAGWTPVYAADNMGVMSIAYMLPDSDEAVIWRGQKTNGLIKQFLRNVQWGPIDYMVVDTPPGTSDVHLSLNQYMKPSGLDGALIVTTPQEVALLDVRKEISFCRKAGIPILGIVENMSGFVCPSCKGRSDIFIPTTGGGAKLAEEVGVPFLGAVPLDPRIGQCSDSGENFLEAFPDSPASTAILKVIDSITSHVLGLPTPAATPGNSP